MERLTLVFAPVWRIGLAPDLLNLKLQGEAAMRFRTLKASRWEDLKGSVRDVWCEMTDEELEAFEDAQEMERAIVKKCGGSSAEVKARLDQILAEFRRDLREEQREEGRRGFQPPLHDQLRPF